MFASSAGHSKPGAHGGILQEFKKKTMQKIVKYAASSPADEGTSPPVVVSPTGSFGKRQIISPHGSGNASKDAMAIRIKRFEEQDVILRELETEMTAMLEQLQGACAAMGRVVEVFTQSFRYDNGAYRSGVDYLAAVKMIRREGAQLMEQAIRFTVLDPLILQLERHNRLKHKIDLWQKLHAEFEEAQLSLDFMRATRQDKEDKRHKAEVKLGLLGDQLQTLEKELKHAIDESTDADAMRHQADLFTTMRLQLAVFFYQTNRSLFSRLSETETEIVVGIGPPSNHLDTADMEHERSYGESRTTLSASMTSDPSVESDLMANEDKFDELRVSMLTLEDFEMGRGPIFEKSDEDGEPTQRSSIVSTGEDSQHVPSLLVLASNPVQGSSLDDDVSPQRPSRLQLLKQRSRSRQLSGGRPRIDTDQEKDGGVLTSLRRSLHERFGSPRAGGYQAVLSGSESGSTPSSPRKCTPRQVLLSRAEWEGVEASLWELDRTPFPPTCMPIGDSCSTDKVGLSHLLSSNERFVYGIAGYLRCDDLGRLAKVNHKLRNLILETPAVWKRSIRAGGLSAQNRSAVWLGVLYGSTPWLSQTAVPHHLSSTEKRKCVYEGLLIKLGTRIANGLFEDQRRAEDDTKLVTWLREIDVDVTRTCKKDIYAEDVAEEWNSSFGASSAGVRNSNSPDVNISTMFKNQRQSKSSPESPRNSAKGKRTELESKIRRVLRAYVMYNPRVGYCQGMNFLVRLLIEVAIDEADCFWLFVGLSEPENDRNLYEPGLAVLQPLFVRFEECFAKQKSELYGHFQQEGVPVAAYTARWFLTLFSKFETFGPTLVIRILDLFVIDGWRTIFSMGLVVLDELESELLQADMEAILQLLQFPRIAMVEPDHTRRRQLLHHALAFSITRSMTSTIR